MPGVRSSTAPATFAVIASRFGEAIKFWLVGEERGIWLHTSDTEHCPVRIVTASACEAVQGGQT